MCNKHLTLKQFVIAHREQIDDYIKRRVPNIPRDQLNNQERRLWILNEHDLYFWAISEGVKDI